jgi:hypothetical protein
MMVFRKMTYYLFMVILGTTVPQSNAQIPPDDPTLTTSAAVDETPEWMTRLASRHQALVEQNGVGTDTALRARLLLMLASDQQARTELLDSAKKSGVQPDPRVLIPGDRKLTAELKEIVSRDGWPTIHLVGFEASNAAMVILIHTEDNVWQSSLLPSLEQLCTEDKIDGSQLATLIDKELVEAGKHQRYGTQFKIEGRYMEVYAVEDPAALDVRRAAAMLPPMDVYKQMLATAYGMAVGKDIADPSIKAVQP